MTCFNVDSARTSASFSVRSFLLPAPPAVRRQNTHRFQPMPTPCPASPPTLPHSASLAAGFPKVRRRERASLQCLLALESHTDRQNAASFWGSGGQCAALQSAFSAARMLSKGQGKAAALRQTKLRGDGNNVHARVRVIAPVVLLQRRLRSLRPRANRLGIVLHKGTRRIRVEPGAHKFEKAEKRLKCT
jgi:hypothetical protein